MTVNHGGNLTEESFHAYLSLVMNSRNYTLEKAGDFMLETFFKGNLATYGPVSYVSYIKAVKSLSGDRC